MVICCVIECSKRSDRDKDVSFCRIPSVTDRYGEHDYELRKKRQAGYLAAISRQDMDMRSLEKYRICSRYFVSNEPADLYDVDNPGWLPMLHLGHSKKKEDQPAVVERWERAKRRGDTKNMQAFLLQLIDTIADEVVFETTELVVKEEVHAIANEQIEVIKEFLPFTKQWTDEIARLKEELEKSKDMIQQLSLEHSKKALPSHEVSMFCEETLQSDDQIRFYTGLPNKQVLKSVFTLVNSGTTADHDANTKLTPFQEFMCTMLKLRLNSPVQDLSYRFNVSVSTISRLLLRWLTQMDIRLCHLIYWPDREQLQKTMPRCFQESFGKRVAIIIDCFEVFIERPSNLCARATTWSNYKHKNTAKVLIGIAPQGTVTYVSEAWGGRVSDKHLTENCGILHNLLPGDIVLADRGFDIADAVGMMQARLHIPAFTKGKSQLSALEVEETRKIANVRVHVERVISNVRQKYSILQSTIPIHFLQKRSNEEIPLIDRIIRVCCALNNVCDSVVPFD